jgi:glycosyltransferase involved in cell wall biosynthesis
MKGQAYLIEACAGLQKKGLYFECHFVGDGPDRTSLTELAERAGISSRVHFHGQQKREQIAQLLQEADVLVAPSVPTSDGRREGIPVVLIEAMSSGSRIVDLSHPGTAKRRQVRFLPMSLPSQMH